MCGMGTGVASSLRSPEKPKGGRTKDSANQQSRSNFRFGQAERLISTGQLNASQRVHLPPINLVVYQESSGISHLEGGFPLRCFQRLSFPNIATQLCHWRDNWCTRGSSIPVLSY